jgi:hypothetical protein
MEVLKAVTVKVNSVVHTYPDFVKNSTVIVLTGILLLSL